MRRCLPALVVLLLQPAPSAAQTRDLGECRELKDKPGELDCYRAAPLPPLPPRARRPGEVADEWRLDAPNLPAAQLTAHRPTYLIVRGTDHINQQPARVAAPQGFDDAELKLQFSLRGEIFSPDQLGERFRIWYAYTQQSNWQVFNGDASRPFRDTNYEPEMIVSYDNRARRGEDAPVSLRPALVNLAVVHQSNGRPEPESRTWWRTYLQGGWQVPGGSLLARRWYAWSESGLEADNPDIKDYAGRVDLMYRSRNGRYGGVNLLLRNNLRSTNRAFLQLDWRVPSPLNIDFHVQLTAGYGESLLDYNHKQTTLGLGFSFWDW